MWEAVFTMSVSQFSASPCVVTNPEFLTPIAHTFLSRWDPGGPSQTPVSGERWDPSTPSDEQVAITASSSWCRYHFMPETLETSNKIDLRNCHAYLEAPSWRPPPARIP